MLPIAAPLLLACHCLAAATAAAAPSPSGVGVGDGLAVMMVPMYEDMPGAGENFIYMGGDLWGAARGNCTLMPGMGFFGQARTPNPPLLLLLLLLSSLLLRTGDAAGQGGPVDLQHQHPLVLPHRLPQLHPDAQGQHIDQLCVAGLQGVRRES